MRTPSKSRHAQQRGFTLVEILVAMTIMGLATVGILSVVLQGAKLYYKSYALLGVNRDIRALTSQMDTDAVTANYFRLYSDFNTRTDSGGEAAMEDGQIGDFVVFVYTDPSQTSKGVSLITRLVGYYREVTDSTNNTGPVHRFDLPVNNVDATTTTIPTLLGNVTDATAYPIITSLAEGLAIDASGTTTKPKLFYNFSNRSIIINAQISESANENNSSKMRIGNTYNFTISPRG